MVLADSPLHNWQPINWQPINWQPINWRRQFRNSNRTGERPQAYAKLWTNMKRRVFSAMPAATFAIAVAAMISAAPLAHAQTDVESGCNGSGGQYSSEVVRPHWDANPTLIETCCTGTGASQQCVTYRDGVQGPTYGGG
jgi:hypothetical protein